MPVVSHSYDPSLPLPPASPVRILVVDDNEPTARALAALLGGARYQAVVAYRGSDALDRAREAVDTGDGAPGFAAAVVDVHLPDMSGLSVAQQLRDILGPAVPIIMMSGDTSMQTLGALSHVGATYFLGKPLNSGMFLEQLGQWVEQPPA